MSLTTSVFTTKGMHCSSCVMLIEMNLEELPGVESVKVDLARGRTDVTFDADKTDPDEISATIRMAGYDAVLAG